MTLLLAIVLLGVLIFVHELGHFLFAKLMKVKVEKFSLGFGPKLAGRKIGETEYQISAFPLGGYVKMLGENPQDEQGEALQLTPEDEKRSYGKQPVWKRLLIVTSGPVFNIVFAAVIFSGVFLNGIPVLYPEVGEVMDDSPAKAAGIINGDMIYGIDGSDINDWSSMTSVIYKSPGREIPFKVIRDGNELNINITPEKKSIKNVFGEDIEIGLIGIKPSGRQFVRKSGIAQSLNAGASKTIELSVLTVVSVVKLIQRVIPAETIGGPIMIFQMASQQANEGAVSFFTFMAVISINLGVINLFPIPILDGGHVVFLTIEAVRRKPLSEKAVQTAQKIGIVILAAIMAFAIYNDIIRVMTGKTIP